MLRLVNFSRNVGGTLIRSTIREDRPKNGVSPSPQFLFWFNETPGLFTPLPAIPLTPLSSPQPSNALQDQTLSRISQKDLAPFLDFTEHKEDHQGFQATSTLTILRALHYGAILAVGYNIFHDKNLTRAIQESSQKLQNIDQTILELEFSDFLESACPVLAVKHQKTAFAQPLENKLEEPGKDCCAGFSKLSIEELFENDKDSLKEPFSTSDYSSHKSDSSTSLQKFSKEELDFLNLQDSIPQAVDALVAVQLVKKGDEDGINRLLQSASLGCTISMFYLGQAYEQGILVKRDMEEAAKYYKEAADGGHMEAKYNLGVFYLRGEGGCQISEDKGLKLVQEAAELGLSEAITAFCVNDEKEECRDTALEITEIEQLFNMGIVMEENELNDSSDQIFALELYRVAALNGHKNAEKRFVSLSKKMSEESSLSSVGC